MVRLMNNVLGIGVLALMAFMVAMALKDLNRGSLDNLPAEDIKTAVDRAMHHG